jgi:hypothetical protein
MRNALARNFRPVLALQSTRSAGIGTLHTEYGVQFGIIPDWKRQYFPMFVKFMAAAAFVGPGSPALRE